MKYLGVYNICERKHKNYEWYESCIDNLLRVKSDQYDYDIAVSGCMVSAETQEKLLARYKDKVFLYFTDENFTVNVTFNHAVNKIVEEKGRYDGYIYFDSGINIHDNINYLDEIHSRFVTGEFGMVTVQTDTDTGFHFVGRSNSHFRDEDYIIPVGKAVNLHVTCFNDKLLQYYGKVIPDIFLAYCTESVFSFLNAALHLKWVIVKDLIVAHKAVDGGSSGFCHYGKKSCPWNNVFGDLDMNDIINDPEAKRLGLGYEEIGNVMIHDENAFTSEGFAKYDELKVYIKEKLYLSKQMLDYDKIEFKFYSK